MGKRKTLGKGLNALFPDIDLLMDEINREKRFWTVINWILLTVGFTIAIGGIIMTVIVLPMYFK